MPSYETPRRFLVANGWPSPGRGGRYAPADYLETVNTEGERFTAKIRPMANEKGANIDVQMNALQYCSRPELLF